MNDEKLENQKETFNYSYSSVQREEIEKIRNKYIQNQILSKSLSKLSIPFILELMNKGIIQKYQVTLSMSLL